jgi:hypothetical protein
VSSTLLDPHNVTVKAGSIITFSLPAALVQHDRIGPELSFDTVAASAAPAPSIGRGVAIVIAVAGMLLVRRRPLI